MKRCKSCFDLDKLKDQQILAQKAQIAALQFDLDISNKLLAAKSADIAEKDEKIRLLINKVKKLPHLESEISALRLTISLAEEAKKTEINKACEEVIKDCKKLNEQLYEMTRERDNWKEDYQSIYEAYCAEKSRTELLEKVLKEKSTILYGKKLSKFSKTYIKVLNSNLLGKQLYFVNDNEMIFIDHVNFSDDYYCVHEFPEYWGILENSELKYIVYKRSKRVKKI